MCEPTLEVSNNAILTGCTFLRKVRNLNFNCFLSSKKPKCRTGQIFVLDNLFCNNAPIILKSWIHMWLPITSSTGFRSNQPFLLYVYMSLYLILF